MSLQENVEQKITAILASGRNISSPSSGPYFNILRDGLVAAMMRLCTNYVDGCHAFIACSFGEGFEASEAAGKCFDGDVCSKTIYKNLDGILKSFCKSQRRVIADAMLITLKLMLEDARPANAAANAAANAKELMKAAETFSLEFPLEARKFVESDGAGLASTKARGGVELVGATQEELGVAMVTNQVYEAAEKMRGTEKKAIRLCVQAVYAALHVYRGDALIIIVKAVAKAAKSTAPATKPTAPATKPTTPAAKSTHDGPTAKRQKT